MFLFFYSIVIRFYYLIIQLAAFTNNKAADFMDGRSIKAQKCIDPNESCIWFHCASLGEFEQARPIIDWMKENKPEKKILLTFYSPSGFNVRKNYSKADHVTYLPLEIPSKINDFLQCYKPESAIFIRYEIWPLLLSILHKNKIPTYLIAAGFRENHWYFKPFGKIMLKYLNMFSIIFHANESSFKTALHHGLKKSQLSGDPRFDRVLAISHQANPSVPLLKAFKNVDTLIAGSTWTEDMIILKNFPELFPSWKWIVVPHNIDAESIKEHLSYMPKNTILWSEHSHDEELPQGNYLLVDEIGMLAGLYSLADIAFIGGGFGKSVHNVAEAAVYGIPVLFGPNHLKAAEALDLLRLGAANCIHHEEELKSVMNIYSDKAHLKSAGSIASEYILHNAGSTEKICLELFN